MSKLTSITSSTEYRLLREISHGGMGCVYEASQYGAEGFIKRVAIKTIIQKHLDNPDFVSRFISEAKLVANLVHPNIVQIYQLGKFSEGYYFAMEYISGITCSELLSMHKSLGINTPIDYVAFIISRIARGLEYAHNFSGSDGVHLDIVHRDVCPKNIMITSEGEGKLADFGIAKARNFYPNNEEKLLLGKVHYMSPEQAMLEKTDARSDIFSLGIVFYELLTGVSPFKTDSAIASLSRVRMCALPPITEYRKDLPEELLIILGKMLAKEPEKRYSSADELGTDLEMMMYSNGYGPTIKKFSEYLKKVFPNFSKNAPGYSANANLMGMPSNNTTKKFHNTNTNSSTSSNNGIKLIDTNGGKLT